MSRHAPDLASVPPAYLTYLRVFLDTSDNEAAALAAYPGCKNPASRGNTCRNHPVIRAEIIRARSLITNKIAMERAEILEGLTHIAKFDPGKLFNEDGTPKRLRDLDESTRRGMVGHEVVFGRDGQITLLGAKTDALDALKTLAKYTIAP